MKKVVALLISILFVVTLAQAVTLTIIQPEGTVTSTRPAGSRVIFKSLTEGIKWWKVTQGNVEVEDGGFTMPNEDVSVEAMYTGNLITVAQTANGKITPGTVGVDENGSKTFTITPDSGYLVSDVLVDGVSVGVRTSYTFTNVTAPHTITATYAQSSATYTVYHYFENTTDTNYTLANTVSKSGTAGAEVVLANEKLISEGFTYSKGSTTANGTAVTKTTIASDGSTNIYLYYSRNKYTLTLAAGDNIGLVVGEGAESESAITASIKHGIELTFGAEVKLIDGYDVVFDKWVSNDTTLLPNQTTRDITFTMPCGDITLVATATKTPITYTITINLDGGSLNSWDSVPSTYTVESDDINILFAPTKEGYTFRAWKGTGISSTATTISIPKGSTGNRTYTAEWKVAIIEPNADTSGANAPVLADGLTPVNWNGTEWVGTTVANWKYNYNSVATATQSKVEGNGDSAWANAKTADGSLYVWIPRYSYKITSGEHSSGNSWNSLDAAGTNKIEVKFSNGTTDDTSNSYIKHPAFTFGTDELEGIWVAKYEASQGNTTSQVSAPTSTTSVAKSIPGVASWRSKSVSNMFDYAYNTYRNADSHLMKNVEWGAVAYLTNAIGRIPYINNSSSYITGNAGGSQDAESASSITNAWNTAGGVKASTTHNVYGIYDMSGGAYEYVAAYYTGGSSSYISSLTNAADKYVDRYSTAYSASKKGDAVYETSSSSSGTNSWDGDCSGAPNSSGPVFLRGGGCNINSSAGVFCFNRSNGLANTPYGFRVVLTGVQPVAEPNAPVLTTGLTPVNWNGTSWVATTVANWDYNYNSVATATHSTVVGNGNGKWANAQTADGSLYVWIPRYSYKITSGEHSRGNSWNSLTAAGTAKIEVKFSNGTTDDTSNSYIKHPAFTFGTDELEGIWVAKYEASQGNTTSQVSAPTSSTSVAKSIPGVASWRSITVSNMFDYAYNTYRNADSHLMKNVEWGAVAYLTNAIGRIPYINNSSSYITGNAGGSQDASSASGTTNAWNTANGVKASTTHNVYGIYDMSGGAWEYVAAYVNNGNSSLSSYASSLVNAATKYKDVYPKGSSDSQANNYAAWSSIKGDAVYETSSSGSGYTSWDGDYSGAPYSYYPVFRRGGNYSDDSGAGVFIFDNFNGNANSNYGFRVVLGIR